MADGTLEVRCWLFEIPKCDGEQCCYYVLGHNDILCAFWQWPLPFSTGLWEIQSSISSSSIRRSLYLMILCQMKYFWYITGISNEKCPVVDMSCLLEKPGGSVRRYRICFHRNRQTIVQLPRIVWSSASRCHQEDWDTWSASKRHTHFGEGSVHFAQKYWHPVRVHKGSALLCNKKENRTVVFQFKNGEPMALTKSPVEQTAHGMKFVRHHLLLWLIFTGTVHRS
jgi:hypothetical protein